MNSLASRETFSEVTMSYWYLLSFPIFHYHLLVSLTSPGKLGGAMASQLDGIDFLRLFWAQMFTLYIAQNPINHNGDEWWHECDEMHLILIWSKTPCSFYANFVYIDIYMKLSLLFCSGFLLIKPLWTGSAYSSQFLSIDMYDVLFIDWKHLNVGRVSPSWQ